MLSTQPDRAETPNLDQIKSEALTEMESMINRVIRKQTWRRNIETIAKEAAAARAERHGIPPEDISFTEEELRNCALNAVSSYATEEINKRIAAEGFDRLLSGPFTLPRDRELASREIKIIEDGVYAELGSLLGICLFVEEPRRNRFRIKFALACTQS